jgi:hypothetical protein
VSGKDGGFPGSQFIFIHPTRELGTWRLSSQRRIRWLEMASGIVALCLCLLLTHVHGDWIFSLKITRFVNDDGRLANGEQTSGKAQRHFKMQPNFAPSRIPSNPQTKAPER